jgi:hypothetical protein
MRTAAHRWRDLFAVLAGLVLGFIIIGLDRLGVRELLEEPVHVQRLSKRIVVPDVMSGREQIPSADLSAPPMGLVSPPKPKMLKIEWAPPIPVDEVYYDLRFLDELRKPKWSDTGELSKRGEVFLTTREMNPGYIHVRLWYRRGTATCEVLASQWTNACPITKANSGKLTIRYIGSVQEPVFPPLAAGTSDFPTKWGAGQGGHIEVFLPEAI